MLKRKLPAHEIIRAVDCDIMDFNEEYTLSDYYTISEMLTCFKLPKWNGFSLKSERRLLAPPSGFIPRKVLASKLGGGLNQRSP